MHELGLAQSIFDLVGRYVPAPQGADVRAVRIRLGALAGVHAESLEFCFAAIAPSTEFPNAALVIDRVSGDDLRVVDVELV